MLLFFLALVTRWTIFDFQTSDSFETFLIICDWAQDRGGNNVIVYSSNLAANKLLMTTA